MSNMSGSKSVIYTDGSCAPNPGRGGWAWIAEGGEYGIGSCEKSTNCRMELAAAIKAIEFCLAAKFEHVTIYSDSEYLCNSMNNGRSDRFFRRKKTKKNLDLLNRLNWLKAKISVDFHWIQRESNPFQSRSDRLARQAINKTMPTTEFIETDSEPEAELFQL